MDWLAAIDRLRDPYERKARIFPGLMVALPVLVPLVCVYGPKHPVLTGVIALLAGCGAIYALASIARGLGKKCEERLVADWGGMPTTLALRHRDTFLDSVSKGRYHEAIGAKLGIPMPSSMDEAENPAKADDTYIGAAKRLREVTRNAKQHSLLLKENIAYGFHRNMRAMRPIGLVTSLAGTAYGLALAKVLQPQPPYLLLQNLADPGLAGGLTLTLSVALMLAWLFYFNDAAVKRIGFVYAERLFECLPSLPPATRKRASKPLAPESNKDG